MKTGTVIKICQVIDIKDETDGERIKVRLEPEDDKRLDNELPFVYPLLPKHLHIKPKIGELVLVILAEAGNGYSNRYYIGPIISQPQHMEKENSMLSALSLYPGAFKQPDIAPSTNPDSHGSLAKDENIALYGRKKTDIILTDNDVRIRCGNRLKDNNADGGLVFNRTDPAYILLKHNDNKNGAENDEYKSTATIVADKINFIGNYSNYPYRTNDKDELITDSEMQKIIETAHKLPYGDILVDFLKLFVRTFAAHVHPFPGLPPCKTSDYISTTSYDFNQILSNSVRIN